MSAAPGSPPLSRLALGTVELGIDYGFRNSTRYARPDTSEAIRVLHRAVDLGSNALDTARSYGASEELIGRAFAGRGHRPWIATKVALPDGCGPAVFWDSLHASLRALRVDSVDLLQIHDTTERTLARGDVFEWFDQARRQGKIRLAGASLYDEAAAQHAAGRTELAALQIPFNLLDQKMSLRAIPTAAAAGKLVLVRSAFLRGVLTAQVHTLPELLAPLRDAALAAGREAGTGSLSGLALRFCLSAPGISSVIVGVRSVDELEANLAAARLGPLPAGLFGRLQRYSMGDSPLVNPTNWRGMI